MYSWHGTGGQPPQTQTNPPAKDGAADVSARASNGFRNGGIGPEEIASRNPAPSRMRTRVRREPERAFDGAYPEISHLENHSPPFGREMSRSREESDPAGKRPRAFPQESRLDFPARGLTALLPARARISPAALSGVYVKISFLILYFLRFALSLRSIFV